MLLSAKHLYGFKIDAVDGDIGNVHNFLFDDRNWAIRYIVVDTGGWLDDRKVLIHPLAAGNPDGMAKLVPVDLRKDQIKNSPEIDTNMPVSRRQETMLFQHYQWEPYWGCGIPPFGPSYSPQSFNSLEDRQSVEDMSKRVEDENADPHLRSIREIIHYRIHATDGEIGHVDDFIIDTDDWVVRYIIVDAGNWLSGRKVVIAPLWIEQIHWADRSVTVSMKTAAIKDSPRYDPSLPINMEYEARLYDYYGRPKYWA